MINWTSSEKLSLHEKPKDCSEKDPVNKHRWEKISANHISDEGLVSRFCDEFLPSTLKKAQLENGQKTLRGISLKRVCDGKKAHGKMFNITSY